MTVMQDEAKIDREAFKALANAINAFTFGIVGDDSLGRERHGLGTGIGVLWKGHHLVVTAAHTLESTPLDRLYFILPFDCLHFADSLSEADWSRVQFQRTHQVENPVVLLGSEGEDLAAIVVPEHGLRATRNFHVFDGTAISPPLGTLVGYLGFPGCRALPVGQHFSVASYCDWGEIRHVKRKKNPEYQITVDYRPAREEGFHKVDPHGLSGSGIWKQRASPPLPALWTPGVELAGLVTEYWDDDQVLACYTVEAITAFLRQKEQEGWP